ncbi:MAG: TIGR02530 family flagellar biosynthesis protein [Solirubrobacterales bacterium]
MTPPVDGIGGSQPPAYVPAPRSPQSPGSTNGGSFAAELQRSAGGVQFSKHAAERVQSRGIAEDPQTVERLEKGVEMAAAKGSRAAVVLVDQNAYVVAVQNRTVITALDQAHMSNHVFTNIDSAVIA